MDETRRFTALYRREGEDWVALCLELDVASQGSTIEEAKENLQEAVALFLETASKEEIEQRYHGEALSGSLEVKVG